MKEYKGRDCLGPLGENLKQGAKRPQKTGIFSTGGPDTQSASDYKAHFQTYIHTALLSTLHPWQISHHQLPYMCFWRKPENLDETQAGVERTFKLSHRTRTNPTRRFRHETLLWCSRTNHSTSMKDFLWHNSSKHHNVLVWNSYKAGIIQSQESITRMILTKLIHKKIKKLFFTRATVETDIH